MGVLLLQLVLLAAFSSTDASNGKHKVLILGGGLAGLRVGQVLHQQGVTDFLILEADSKLGGRFLSYCMPGVPACVSDIHVEPSLASPHPIRDLLDNCSIAYAPEVQTTFKSVDDDGKDVTAEVYEAFTRLGESTTSLWANWSPDEGDIMVCLC